MKKIIAIVLVIVMGLSLFALSACAPKSDLSDFEEIQAKGVFVVGYDNKFPPMGFVNVATGEDVGFDIDLAKAVFEEIGIKVKFQAINWQMKESELASKAIDCIWNGYTITDKRKDMVTFSAPYLKNEQVVVVRTEDVNKYAALSEMKGTNMLAQSGSTAIDVIAKTENLKDNKLVTLDDNVQILNELLLKKADIAVMDYVVANYMLAQDNAFNGKLSVVKGVSLDYEEYGIGFRKNADDTAKKVNDALENLKKSGKLKEVADKWGLSDLLLV